MTRVNHPTTDNGRDGLAISLGLLSAGLSVMFVAYLFMGVVLSWGGRGPDWSVSFGRALLGLFASLAPCVCIAGLSIAALRATGRPGAIAPGFAGFLAIPSLIFSILVGGLYAWVFVAGAKNPNRALYPLHDAACKADLDAVRIQLKRGVSATKEFYVGSASDGRDALGSYFHCFRDVPFDRLLVDELLRAGADINGGQRRARYTALESVVLNARPPERIEIVKYLVAKGASPNASSIYGSALETAVNQADVAMTRTLIQLGAPIDSLKLAARLGLTDPRVCEVTVVGGRTMPVLDLKSKLETIDFLFEQGFLITREGLAQAKRQCPHVDHPIVFHIESKHRDRIVHEVPQTPSK